MDLLPKLAVKPALAAEDVLQPHFAAAGPSSRLIGGAFSVTRPRRWLCQGHGLKEPAPEACPGI
jgi:hypothetical protein